MTKDIKIFAVVVTYFPDLTHLEGFLNELDSQFDGIVVVDNGSAASLEIMNLCSNYQNINLILNNINLGIGAAQNIGIKYSLSMQMTHIVLFDQDSMIHTGFAQQMLNAENILKSQGISIGALGPKLIDQTTGNIIPFITFVSGIKKRISVIHDHQILECFSLLSSGTMISQSALNLVGNINEKLFLEYVDVEWGARARSLGLISFGVGSAKLIHNLGDRRIKIGPIIVPLHSPLRHYYTMRNAVAMQKLSYIPNYWKVYDAIRTIRGFFTFALFNPPRTQQVKYMIVGLYHGFLGKSGAYPGQ